MRREDESMSTRPRHGHKLTLDELSEEDLGGLGLDDTLTNFSNTLCERAPDGVAINSDGARMQASGEEVDDVVYRDELTILNENIGRGACSQVQLARSRIDGRYYALKIFNIFDGPKRRQLFTEVKSLWNVHCPALVRFHGAYLEGGKVCCILEYMDCGTLDDIYDKIPPDTDIPEDVLASLAYQMLWGLAFLQHDSQLHRDVKPANVLVNRRGEAKLSDFGIARRLEDEGGLAQTVTGTFKYMSPERLNGRRYSYNSDVWSVGVILLEGAQKSYPFGAARNQIELVQSLHEIDIVDFMRSCDLSDKFVDFLRGCLTLDEADRYDAERLLDSPVFEEYDIQDYDSAAQILRQWVDDFVPPSDLDFEAESKLMTTLGSSVSTMEDERETGCLDTLNSLRESEDEISQLARDVKDLDLREAKRQYAFRSDSLQDSKVAETK